MLLHCVIDCSCGWEFSSRIIWFNYGSGSLSSVRQRRKSIMKRIILIQIAHIDWIMMMMKSVLCAHFYEFLVAIPAAYLIGFHYDLLLSAASIVNFDILQNALKLVWESHRKSHRSWFHVVLENCTINLMKMSFVQSLILFLPDGFCHLKTSSRFRFYLLIFNLHMHTS